jgi:hypothetical protein
MTGGGLAFLGMCLIFAAFIVMSVRIYQARPDFVVRLLRYALIAAFGLVFSVVSVAIGFRISERHTSSYSRSLKSVQEIWGGAVVQESPSFYFNVFQEEQYEDQKTGQLRMRQRLVPHDMGFDSQDIAIKMKKNIRKRGLLVFPGYSMQFSGTYIIRNFLTEPRMLSFYFMLPSDAGNITGISVAIDGRPYEGDTNLANGIQWEGLMRPGEQRTVTISYSAQGSGDFTYAMANRRVEIRKLAVALSTDFSDITIPEGAMVPTKKSSDNSGAVMQWAGEKLVTGQNIALKFKISGNYGEVVSKMFFYSPLAIVLFLGFLLVYTVARGLRLHPMNFLFIITAYFIFYLLGSYLISYVHVVAAVVISLSVSTGILAYYCYLIKTADKSLLITGVMAGAGLFQWVFSIAFFFPEHTGFMVTAASIIGFIALMKATADIDWENKW